MTDFADEAHELRKLNEQLKRKLESSQRWARRWKAWAKYFFRHRPAKNPLLPTPLQRKAWAMMNPVSSLVWRPYPKKDNQ